MELKYVKNIQFTRLVKSDGQLKEFNFRKPNGKQEGPFTVDVIDVKEKRIIFNMELKDNSWKIITAGLPEWITENESSFHDMIEEEFKTV
ncbi:MAG: hypothetical protein JNM14_14625 [Ferruginibacter sp.]|nr:hypothetical protein [Ferruginibacter sp.]